MLPVCVEWLSWCVPPEPWHRERVEEEGMSHPLQSPFTRRMAALLLLAMLAAISPRSSTAQAPPAQDPPAKSDSTPQATPADADGEASVHAAAVAALPQRFVAVVFDDTNMLMQDAVFVRDAATRLFGALAPTDRVGMFSTSGQFTQDFTQDHESLKKSLLGIVPRPVGNAGFHDCPEISYYQADLIENKRDAQALAVATEDALVCAFGGDSRMVQQAQQLAQMASGRALASGDAQIEYVYRHLEETMRRLSVMPGQRILALVSPGFIVTTLTLESSDLVDRANRANIVINTIDARGLYAPDLL